MAHEIGHIAQARSSLSISDCKIKILQKIYEQFPENRKSHSRRWKRKQTIAARRGKDFKKSYSGSVCFGRLVSSSIQPCFSFELREDERDGKKVNV